MVAVCMQLTNLQLAKASFGIRSVPLSSPAAPSDISAIAPSHSELNVSSVGVSGTPRFGSAVQHSAAVLFSGKCSIWVELRVVALWAALPLGKPALEPLANCHDGYASPASTPPSLQVLHPPHSRSRAGILAIA